MVNNRGVDMEVGRENRQIRALWRAVEAMQSERRAPATEINSGSWVINGGDVLMLDEDGDVLFRLGPQLHGDRGLTMAREDGSTAITIARLFDGSTQQELRLHDRFGNELLAEEALGSGISRPYLHIPMQPVQATPGPLDAGPHGWEVPVTSGAFVDVARAGYARHNQFGTFRLRVGASDATTAGEVRLVDADTSEHLGQFLTGPYTAERPVGSTGYTEVTVPSIFIPGAPWVSITLALQVRRTAGAGTLRVVVTESRGGIE